ncbi:fimbrial protein [Ralstonia chuxiongensis]|uniref:Type 1 fimbrial protein n=1 Tax=Ralstonia chuxiongensis TaxID=2957504 RepID=A0AA41WX79_9RALS|nr:fimbrial protein [Ralstonia chuxiongensis]MCP1174117.1 type 1 fimbrial protein [Ralstonia chuxiongensis]
MKRLSKRRTQMLRATAFAILGLAMMSRAEAVDLVAFSGSYALPGGMAEGTVVARRFYTPTQLCGEVHCELYSFHMLSAGGREILTGSEVGTKLIGLSMRVLVNGKPQEVFTSSSPSIKFSSPMEVQLFRNDGDVTTSTTSRKIHFTLYMRAMSKPNDTVIAQFLINDATLTRIEGTCSVPSQTVELPPTVGRRLEGIGSTAGVRDFNIKVNGCPKGYNRVGYTLEPMGGVADAPGVLPLGTDSTAKGVKIRLTGRDGLAAKFGTSIKVDDYDKATGGSYMIPMQASYIQTDAAVTPGTVKGAISLRLDYQ